MNLLEGILLVWRDDLENVQRGAREKISDLALLQVAQAAAIDGWACAELATTGTEYHTLVVAFRDDALAKVRLTAYRREPPQRGAMAGPTSADQARRLTEGSSGLQVDAAASLTADPEGACARYSGPRRHQ